MAPVCAFASDQKRNRESEASEVNSLGASRQLAARVEEWAKQQPDQPSRSEAIRRMIEIVLKKKEKRLTQR
jgi:hypothetical protein